MRLLGISSLTRLLVLLALAALAIPALDGLTTVAGGSLPAAHAATYDYDLLSASTNSPVNPRTAAQPTRPASRTSVGFRDVSDRFRATQEALAPIAGGARTVGEALNPGGQLIGQAGSSDAIRIVQGGQSDAETLFNELSDE